MNTKLITALLAFSTTFGASTVVSRLFVAPQTVQEVSFTQRVDRNAQRKISQLLQRDIANGTLRDHQVWQLDEDSRPPQSPATLAKYTEIIDNYVDKSESLDDSDLPAEFRAAWRAHVKIWREHANFLAQLKDQSKRGQIGAETEARLYAAQDAKITETWFKTLQVAGDYDVFPAGAY